MSDRRPVSYCLVTASYRQPDGANRTGWATYAETMAECLRRDGVDVTVVVIHEALDTDPALRDRSPGVTHIQLRWVYQLSNILPGLAEGLQLLRAVRRLDRQRHFDVVEGPNVAGICWALALRYRRKFLLRVHTSLVSPPGESPIKRSWRQRFKWYLDAFCGRAAHTVVTHSQSHATTVARQYGIPVDAITVVPHAVPDPGPLPAGSPGRILAIAGAVRRKGVDVLVDAFARIYSSLPDAELVIVGTTPDELTEILVTGPGDTPGLRGRIHALRPLTDEALDHEWRRAGVLVVPSRYESFGLVAVEGMARARPVIVANGGALGEVVGDAAVVVPRDDPQGLADAMDEMLRSADLRAKFSAAGRRHYEECYRPEVLVKRMHALISRVTRVTASG